MQALQTQLSSKMSQGKKEETEVSVRWGVNKLDGPLTCILGQSALNGRNELLCVNGRATVKVWSSGCMTSSTPQAWKRQYDNLGSFFVAHNEQGSCRATSNCWTLESSGWKKFILTCILSVLPMILGPVTPICILVWFASVNCDICKCEL
jgi:hypothetical protein